MAVCVPIYGLTTLEISSRRGVRASVYLVPQVTTAGVHVRTGDER